ncbi:MAG: hypothetical protein ACO4CZ_19970 [Planctomycetota bacterium]
MARIARSSASTSTGPGGASDDAAESDETIDDRIGLEVGHAVADERERSFLGRSGPQHVDLAAVA